MCTNDYRPNTGKHLRDNAVKTPVTQQGVHFNIMTAFLVKEIPKLSIRRLYNNLTLIKEIPVSSGFGLNIWSESECVIQCWHWRQLVYGHKYEGLCQYRLSYVEYEYIPRGLATDKGGTQFKSYQNSATYLRSMLLTKQSNYNIHLLSLAGAICAYKAFERYDRTYVI